jgi:hypothetical protein
MCDRRILSSDPHDWDELISEAAGAEKYSRRLSERITDGYAAKFDRRDDPLALPEKAAMARPTGVGRALATHDIPIEGRDEWLAAARRLA